MNYKEKVLLIRDNIVSNVQIYKEQLAGKYYLYIFENQFFEMYFGIENFMHLTGVGSKVNSREFYKLAKSRHLEASQMFFSKRFPLKTALQKTALLSEMPKFVKEGYFVIKDLNTETEFYPYAITNLDQSILIGLKEEEDKEIYIPKSLRVKGNIFNKIQNNQVFEINHILCKTDIAGKYNEILYNEKQKSESINQNILEKIDKNIIL